MFETEIKLPRVILCAVDTGEYNAEASMNELAELARTAGRGARCAKAPCYR